MSKYATQAGEYTGRAVSWDSRSAMSGNVGIRVKFTLHEQGGQPLERELLSSGTFWVLRADGTTNEKVVGMLNRCLGWDGEFKSIYETPPLDQDIHLRLEEESYNGKDFCVVKWMRLPGSGKDKKAAPPVDADALDAQHGKKIKGAIKAQRDENSLPPADDGIPFGWLIALPLLGFFL